MRLALLAALALVLAAAAPASAFDGPGVEHLHYRFGPIHIRPGQNDIRFAVDDKRPPVDGWIVGFRPNLVRTDGTIPRVDVLHLHHGVWLSNLRPLFAAGEEKTAVSTPAGYGWRYRTTDSWILNHMLHDLTPTTADVFITYDIDFIPDGSPAAAGLQEVQTQWMDVTGLHVYPVFDVHRGAGGRDGRFTYPEEAKGLPRG